MNKYSKLSYSFKREIVKFSEKICKGLKITTLKLVAAMLYGMSESNSCHLSKISRALKEPILLKKTIERLSRGLKNFTGHERLRDNYIEEVRGRIDERTIFVIDGSDMTKPCSKAMEGLSKVRDGNTGAIKDGYMTLEVAGLTHGHGVPLPIYERVYSSVEKSFVSEDNEVLKALGFLSEKFGGKGIRTLDRGYDAIVYYEYFLKKKEKFIIRAKKNRDLRYNGETMNILKIAERYKGKYRMDFRGKSGKKIECKISIAPVALPKYPNKKLSLVIVRGLGKSPMLLLSNLESDDTRLAAAITKVYLMRWRIEEYFKFKKQQFDFEDFRVRSLNAIRTLHLLGTLLAALIGILSAKRDESIFVMELIEASKRIYDYKTKAKTRFMNYAIADGIFAVLNKTISGIRSFFITPKPSLQLSFL